tara:strand:- start:3835 stop:4797 length:963 start_codon:yes stop_codon:yes gene_type:complete
MVLGTPHLSQLPDSFRIEMIEPLVARLAQWAPTAVAVEDSSGLLCEKMRGMSDRYTDAIDNYCFDPSVARSVTGLTVPAANAKMETMLADWAVDPSPEMRRELAAASLAAGEPGSAVVQWLRLPKTEQFADDVLTEQLVTLLMNLAGRKNETYSVAARVAAQSGLDRLWSVDDQSTFMGPEPDGDAYGAAIMAAWDNPATRMQAAEANALASGLSGPDGLLAMYRAYNEPTYADVKYQSDFGAALTEPSEEGYGRRYVAYWETRNLRMVANMREVLGRQPGTRMLTIVGASHKGYYEAYLAQMRDVELVDVIPLLEQDID